MHRLDRALVWFRRDLRDFDHAALEHATRMAARVHCVFVFDTEILDGLTDRADRRVEFIHASIAELHASLAAQGGGLIVRHGRARSIVPALAVALRAAIVVANRDYEPAAKARDAAVAAALAQHGIEFVDCKDQAIFDRDEILTKAGTPFSVFTAYKNAWLAALQPAHLAAHTVSFERGQLAADDEAQAMPSLAELGFAPTNLHALPIRTGMRGGAATTSEFLERIGRYRRGRDFPAADATSMLSVHLRFGTVSIRTLAREAHARMLGGDDAERSANGDGDDTRANGRDGAAAWLSELVWRDFYFMVLDHRPDVADHAFRRELDALAFPNDPQHFRAWREGRTGYPLVDAGMRQLETTGWMHNRLRMITASFLVKDLLVDWRQGERHFAAKLIDYDLAANNGGWQWAASTGCDAQPYFRIFNPVTQSQRFDPDGRYIRRHVPELARVPAASIHAPWRMTTGEQRAAGVRIGRDYPAPVVDHALARRAALELYGVRTSTRD